MDRRVLENMKKKAARKRQRNRRIALILVLAMIVGSFTTYGLTRQAQAQSTTLVCAQEEHTHGDACYTENRTLTCTQEEGEDHTHDETCYTSEQVLSCGLEEHTHSDACYAKEQEPAEETAAVNDAESTPVANDQQTVEETTAPEETSAPQETVTDADEKEAASETASDEKKTENETAQTSLEETPVLAEETAQEEVLTAAAADTSDATDITKNVEGKYTHTIDVQKKTSSGWETDTTFVEDSTVNVVMEFEIGDDVVTKESPTVSYTFNDGLFNDSDFDQSKMQGDVKNTDGTTVGTYIIKKDSDGKYRAYITYNEDFANGKAFQGSLHFETVVRNTNESEDYTYQFDDSGSTITITKKAAEYGMSLDKSATVEYEGNDIKKDDNGNPLVDYTITVSTWAKDGTGDNITLTDTMYSALAGWEQYDSTKAGGTYTTDLTLVKKDSSGNVISTQTIAIMGQSTFTVSDLPALNKGEKYELTYTAAVSTDNTNYATTGQLNAYNSVKGKSDKTTETEKHNYTQNIYKSYDSRLYKTGYFNKNSGVIEWTITVENPENVDLGNLSDGKAYSITDLYNNGEAATYENLKVTDAAGNTVSASGQPATQDGKLFSYTFPTGSTSNKYTITYTTVAPTKDCEIANKVEDNGAVSGTEGVSKEGTVKVDYRDLDLAKTYLSTDATTSGNRLTSDKANVFWNVKVTLPDSSFPTEGYVLTDTIQEAKDADGDVIEGVHYGKYSDIYKAIFSDSTTLKTSEKTYKITDSNCPVTLTLTCYTADGNEIASDDDKVASFKISVQAKEGQTFVGEELNLTYPTYMDTTGKNGFIDLKNTVALNDLTKEAEKTFRKSYSFTKTAYSGKNNSGNVVAWSQNSLGSFAYVADDSSKLTLMDPVLTYRLFIPLGYGDMGDINITDTLPEGFTYVDGSLLITSGGTNNMNQAVYGNSIWNNKEDILSLGATAQQADGGNVLTIQIPSGYGSDWHFTNSSCFMCIYYQVQIPESIWASLKDGSTNALYTNSATWGDTGSSDSISTEFDRTNVTVDKIGSYNEDTNIATYDVRINTMAEDMDPNSDTLTLIDTLTVSNAANAVIDLASVKLYNYDENAADYKGSEINGSRYTFSYDESKKELMLVLPDSLACVVEYQYRVNTSKVAEDSFTLENSASLNGQWSTKTSTKESKQSSGSDASRAQIDIYKVDSQDYSKLLTGVEFQVSAFSETEGWQNLDGTATTDENGRISFAKTTGTASVSDLKLKQDVLYKLVENKGLDGYDSNVTKYFVWMSGSKTADELWNAISTSAKSSELGVEKKDITFFDKTGGNYYVENPYTRLTVSKVWIDNEGKDMAAPATIVTGALYKGDEKIEEFTLSAENDWTKTWDELDTSYTYRVEELKVGDVAVAESDYTVSYTNNNISSGQIVMTNKQKPKSEVTVEKVWKNHDGSAMTVTPANITFVIKQGGETIATATMTKDALTISGYEGTETLSSEKEANWSFKITGLPEGIYTCVETAIEGKPIEETTYEASFESNGSTTTFTNTKAEEEGVTLPKTGGSGTMLFTLMGLAVLGTCGALYLRILNKRRSQRR